MPQVIGPFLNAFAILFGALFGLIRRKPLSLRTQQAFKSALAAVTLVCGLQLLWTHLTGGATHGLEQLFVALLAIILGNLLGKLLALQKMSNRIGRFAAGLLDTTATGRKGSSSDGFLATSLLFCAAPLGLIGAVTDGLDGYFFPLLIKGVMDGLAMTSFVKMFRWPVALSAIPVFFFLQGLATATHAFLLPMLNVPGMIQALNIAAGLIVCSMTLVILEVRRVELANYLPALALAPLLAHWLL